MAELNDLLVKGDARFLGNVYMNDSINSKIYSGIYGSANDQARSKLLFCNSKTIKFLSDVESKI